MKAQDLPEVVAQLSIIPDELAIDELRCKIPLQLCRFGPDEDCADAVRAARNQYGAESAFSDRERNLLHD
jgi:hypothetical protein